jgi:TatA/E family protein of Tat protein translocase
MELFPPLAFGFGGPQDWVILAVVALLVFGPKRLPDLGRQLGEAMRDFNKLKDELTGAMHSVHEEAESAAHSITKAYSEPRSVSSPTVEAATNRRVYDQEPEDLMAPAVPELHPVEHVPAAHESGKLLIPPPAAVAVTAEEAHEKGH